MSLTLVTGGTRSGKSRRAEALSSGVDSFLARPFEAALSVEKR